jgi:hypothetical protein
VVELRNTLDTTKLRRSKLIKALQLAISSRISDRDDFRSLVLRSSDGTAEVSFRRGIDSGMVCEYDGTESHVPENKIFSLIEDFVLKGFSSLTCECWSGDVRIEVPSKGQGKMKITYSQPSPQLDLDGEKHLIDPEEASNLLKAIDILNNDGYMTADMRRKYVQIDNFVKLILPLLRKSALERKIFILDSGSGKSYLSFVMNYFLREKLRRSCHFFCIDTNADVIGKSLQVRDRLGYDNMNFFVSRIRDFEPEEKIDIVCSLHACDTASDEAIARGIQLGVPFLLIVPCCQHEVISQFAEASFRTPKAHPLKAITRHGLYKARLADLLTDALRTLILEAAGYKVSVTEYVSPIYTPKNIMIQAEKVQSRNKMAMEQYMELKAMFGDVSLELERMLPELFS